MLDFELALTGNYEKVMRSRSNAVLDGLYTGTRQSGELTKHQLRRDIEPALGPRMANTVRADYYPAGGRSWSPVAIVYSKVPHIMAIHADGGIIKAAEGALAVPLAGSPAATIRQRRGESRVEAARRKYGELIFIKRPGKAPLLAARVKITASGRYRKIRSLTPYKTRQGPRWTKGNLAILPLFTLQRQVRIQRRLNARAIMAKAQRRHPARLAFALREAQIKSARETRIR